MVRRVEPALLLTVSGAAWFLADVWPESVFLHRALLFHAILACPGWRPRAPASAVVAAAYLLALMPAVWARDAVSVVSVGVLVAAAWTTDTRHRAPALAGAVVLATGVTGSVLLRLVVDGLAGERLAWLTYAASCATVGVVLAVGLSRRAVPLANRVVELAESTSGTLRDVLAHVLDDPALQVGYWDGQHYRDSSGQEVAAQPEVDGRAVTFVRRDAQPFAVVVHTASILDDPPLVSAVTTATRLTATNAILQTTIHRQLSELKASRRRLLDADDTQRRQLAGRVRSGAGRHLDVIRDLLLAAAGGGEPPPGVGRALAVLEQTDRELDQLARGLYPPELAHGLDAALRSLAASDPSLEVDVTATCVDPPPDVAAGVYFVCAEGIANVHKHADASAAGVSVTITPDVAVVHVADHGPGGADPARGSGLSGIRDRVEALGGTLSIDSPPNGGTRLQARIPTARSAASA
jgi:signal transduction histidine kinase